MNKVKLLIVEDDQPFGWALKDVVARAGYRFRVARSGAEALEAVAQESFDLVLQDIKLPDANGLDVLQEITACQPRCGSIMMTGQGTVEDAIRAMKLGAFDFLPKPFRMEKLFISIESFFESKGLAITCCSLLGSCLFFKKGLPEMPCTTESLKDKYCRGNYGECARFIVCQACGSDKVPHNLSPNDAFETLNVLEMNHHLSLVTTVIRHALPQDCTVSSYEEQKKHTDNDLAELGIRGTPLRTCESSRTC